MVERLHHPFDMIEVERRCFIETNNPMHAWMGYYLARTAKVETPAWIMKYLDFVAANIMAISYEAYENGGTDMGPMLARAMAFTKKGRGSKFADYHHKWIIYGMGVRARLLEGYQEDHAIQECADSEQVSYSTVHRAWKRYDRLFPGKQVFPEDAVNDPAVS